MESLNYSINTSFIELNDILDFNEILDDNNESCYENIALCSESAMEAYLDKGYIDTEAIKKLIKERKLFPCYFGSALKQNGIDAFLKLRKRNFLWVGLCICLFFLLILFIHTTPIVPLGLNIVFLSLLQCVWSGPTVRILRNANRT